MTPSPHKIESPDTPGRFTDVDPEVAEVAFAAAWGLAERAGLGFRDVAVPPTDVQPRYGGSSNVHVSHRLPSRAA